MGRYAGVHHFVEEMARVRQQLRARQYGPPNKLRILQSFDGQLFGIAGLERATLGEVAFEVRRVYLEATYASRRAESDDRPIVPRPAAPFGFPAIAHVRGAARHNQIMTMAEKHIAARKHQPAILDGPKIDLSANLFQAIPIRHDFAVNAQARHAAIGVDFETKVRPALLTGNRKWVRRVAV